MPRDSAEDTGDSRSPPCSPAVSQPPLVPPRLVLAGLATLQRQELCNFLAIFDQLSAMNVASDSIRDFRGKLSRHSPQREQAFKTRVQRAADGHFQSDCPEPHLRLLVWVALLDAFSLPRLIPLAVATADRRAAEVASRTVRELRDTIQNDSTPADSVPWRKAAAKIRAVFLADRDADFGDVVRFEVARRIGECADALPELREEIVASLRGRMGTLPRVP